MLKELRKEIKKIVKKYDNMSSRQALILAALISMILAILSEIKNPNGNYFGDLKGVIITFFPMIFINIAPVMLVFRGDFIRKIKKNPLYAVGMILYFMLVVPVFLGVQRSVIGEDIRESKSFFYIVVNALNYIALIMGHVILIRYVFLDVILKRRKPTGKDTIIVFMTYLSMGVSFGFFYALVTIMSDQPAFSNMSLEMVREMGVVKLYMRHIYYSFITLTSVGFGDIYPTSWMAQALTVMEAVLGVFLLSFSLGIILSSESDEGSVREDEAEKFKRELLIDIETLIDKKLEGIKKEDTEKDIKKDMKKDIINIVDSKDKG